MWRLDRIGEREVVVTRQAGRLRSCGWLLGFMVLTIPVHAVAEGQTITATGSYRVGKHDTRGDAQYLALLDAKRQAVDQAAGFLANLPAVKQLRLSRDELLAYSVVLLEFQDQPPPSELNLVGAVASASITIRSDPGALEGRLHALMENERAKAELTRAKDKIERYRKEVEADSTKLDSVSGKAEIDAVLQHRRDLLDLIETETQLARTWGLLLAAQGAKRPSSAAPKGPASPERAHASAGGSDAEEHRKKGVLLNTAGQYDEAVTEFRLALQLVPTLPRGHLGLGAALQGKGDIEGAIAEYRTELHAHPEDVDTHNNLATALQRKGELDGAIAEYREALRLNPDDAVAHFNLGTALAAKGGIDDTVTEYRSATRLRPDFFEAYFELGNVLKAKGQTTEAAEAYRKFLDLAPDTPANKQWIEQARRMLGEIGEKARRQHRRSDHGPSQ